MYFYNGFIESISVRALMQKAVESSGGVIGFISFYATDSPQG